MRKNRADCVHIMKTCKELANNGFDVVLVTPHVFRKEYKYNKNEIWELYGLRNNSFKIVELPTVIIENLECDNKLIEKFYQMQQFVIFTIYLLILLSFIKKDAKIFFFSKNFIFSFVVATLGKIRSKRFKHIVDYPVFLKYQKTHQIILKNADFIIPNKKYHVNLLNHLYHIPFEKMYNVNFVSQYNDFINDFVSKDEAREKLNIDKNVKIAMYAGKISPTIKEIHYYIEAAKILKDVKFYLIGAKDDDIRFYKIKLDIEKIKNVFFEKFQPLTTLFLYIQAADVLLSYYTSHNQFYKYQIGPAKSSLYTISMRPIIMPDLESLRDIFDDTQVFFVKPDNPLELSKKIEYILNHREVARNKATNAFNFAKDNSFEVVIGKLSNIILNLN